MRVEYIIASVHDYLSLVISDCTASGPRAGNFHSQHSKRLYRAQKSISFKPNSLKLSRNRNERGEETSRRLNIRPWPRQIESLREHCLSSAKVFFFFKIFSHVKRLEHGDLTRITTRKGKEKNEK